MPKVTLRNKGGSFLAVVKVYAYDPLYDVALVKFEAKYGQPEALEQTSSRQLEAVLDDPQNTFQDVIAELRKRAGEIINDDN